MHYEELLSVLCHFTCKALHRLIGWSTSTWRIKLGNLLRRGLWGLRWTLKCTAVLLLHAIVVLGWNLKVLVVFGDHGCIGSPAVVATQSSWGIISVGLELLLDTQGICLRSIWRRLMIGCRRHVLLEETRGQVVSLIAQWWTYLWWSLRLYILWCSLTVILLWRWYTGCIGHSDQLISHMIIISVGWGAATCSLSLVDKLRGTRYLGPRNYLALAVWRNATLHPLIRRRVRMSRTTLDTHTRILWICVVRHWSVRWVRYVYGLSLH